MVGWGGVRGCGVAEEEYKGVGWLRWGGVRGSRVIGVRYAGVWVGVGMVGWDMTGAGMIG